MDAKATPLIYGPAYLDFIVEIDRSLAPGICLDQSVLAVDSDVRADGRIVLRGPTGDHVVLTLPVDERSLAVTLQLAEPLLWRRFGATTSQIIDGTYTVRSLRKQLGGMGAGFAKALGGRLRFPLGVDEIGRFITSELAQLNIEALPVQLSDVPSDRSFVILSTGGEKVAVGLRRAMTQWKTASNEYAMVEDANMLVFCGASNRLMAHLLSSPLDVPIMCAPSMRNIDDTDIPLASFADRIHYLALNGLEWEHLKDREHCRRSIPIISVTDGPHASHIYLRDGQKVIIPTEMYHGPIDANRAGETFASTLVKVLLREAPEFHRSRTVAPKLAEKAGRIATKQAIRQLAISGFAFPPDDWMDD